MLEWFRGRIAGTIQVGAIYLSIRFTFENSVYFLNKLILHRFLDRIPTLKSELIHKIAEIGSEESDLLGFGVLPEAWESWKMDEHRAANFHRPQLVSQVVWWRIRRAESDLLGVGVLPEAWESWKIDDYRAANFVVNLVMALNLETFFRCEYTRWSMDWSIWFTKKETIVRS